jgi:hypothetical protein
MVPKLYRQVISDPDTDLWEAAIEDKIDNLWYKHPVVRVDRSINRKIVDSKWVFNNVYLERIKEATTYYDTNQ